MLRKKNDQKDTPRFHNWNDQSAFKNIYMYVFLEWAISHERYYQKDPQVWKLGFLDKYLDQKDTLEIIK